ncbi:MAG: diaminopimelate epimerase [Alphaproteobacteria bacterium]|nr:diaminopimelate epimerase [Alphaproteobacteria bacterium]
MNTFPFTKAVALGNDFVLLHTNYFVEDRGFIQKFSDRRCGIGFDQLVVYDDEHYIRFFNADGSEAEACGNGSRCIAYYLMQRAKKRKITLHTIVGPLHAEMLNENDLVAQIKMTMHPPKIIQKTKELDDDIRWFLDKETFTTTFVIDVGNPHLVIFLRDKESVDKEAVAPQLEKHPFFKHGANISFVTANDGSPNQAHLELNVWERGVGSTPACGTAAFASAFSYSLLHPHHNEILVEQKGGELLCNKEKEQWFVTGEAKLVFDGTYHG